MRSKILGGLLALTIGFLLATNPLVAQAAKQITGKQIKNGSITGKDIKPNSLQGKQIKEAKLGKVPKASTADAVGTLAANGVQDKASILFALIEPAGNDPVVKRARGVIGAERASAGFFDVQFDRDVSGCAVIATYAKTGTNIDPHYVNVRAPSPSNLSDPAWVGVILWDASGFQVDGDGFSIAAFCP